MTKLTEHFSLEDLVFSQTAIRRGIDNTPSATVISNLRDVCLMILEPLQGFTGRAVRISSGYRSPELNAAIGGSATSQHCFGQAVDISVAGWTTEQLYQFIKHSGLPYRQLIQEFDRWVHVAISNGDGKMGENLRATHDANGKTVYTLMS